MTNTTESDIAAHRRQRWMILALLVLLGLASNAWRQLVQPDEGRYAEIPREMLVSGDYVVPHLNALPYVEKPPLQYWATAAAFAVFGVNDWASRLWNLLLGIAGVVVVYMAGRRLWSARAGEFAALILMSTPLYMLVGQLNLLDMGLTFFLTAALCAFLLAQRAGVRPDESRRYMLLCWVSVGLGFLQKGLVAFAVPFIALVAYSLIARDTGIWKRLHLGKGAAIVAALSLPWLVALGLRDGAYAWFFLVHEHFTRFMTTEHHRDEAWWFFLAVLVAGALPWSGLMLKSVYQRLRRRSVAHFDPGLALALWAVVVVFFFSLSGSKLVPYIMPCLPPLALLAGRALDERAGRVTAGLVLGCAAGLAAVLLGATGLATQMMHEGPTKAAYLTVGRWAFGAGAVVLLGTAIAAYLWWRARLRAAIMALGLGLYLGWMTFLGGSNIMASIRGTPGASALITPRLAPGASFYCVGAYLQSLTFELGRTCTLVEYTGELQLQFDRDGQHQPLDFAAFAARWRTEAAGIALLHRESLARLQAERLELRVVAEYPDFLIVEHP
jgi:4-amino-4-deoxy-L-arabinose transferase-like glycosyltransferase